jgi:hypothetical protein
VNSALFYLYLTLLKRKALHFCRGLRRPTTLIGFAAVLFLAGFMVRHRRHDVFGQLVRPASMIGGGLVMLCGSLFKGFLQRGLAVELPDIEFLFTSPFTRRQIILYRLLPSYLFALIQGVMFLALFAPHLKRPILAAICFTFFQVLCFHVATAAAIFAGTISQHLHHRIRWMMLGFFFLLSAAYLHAAWGVRVVPAFATAQLAQLLFYPALTLPDVATARGLAEWAARLVRTDAVSMRQLWQAALSLGGFAGSAAVSLLLLFKLKGDIFESSLATTTRAAERRLRLRHGRRLAVAEPAQWRSSRLPQVPFFGGVGAIVWKNLLVAWRSKRELALAVAFTLLYSAFLFALLWRLHDYLSRATEAHVLDVTGFDMGIAACLVFLGFLLQWMLPFDFRRDGRHIVGFRTLPVSAFALALAEIAVPTALCLACQAPGVVVLLIYARLDWLLIPLLLLAYPAVALALNGVWNLHYLLSATRRAGGRAHSPTAVSSLMVVALSFLIFYPAGWTSAWIGDHFAGNGGQPALALAGAGFLAVQYFVDLMLVLVLAKMLERFEVARDS